MIFDFFTFIESTLKLAKLNYCDEVCSFCEYLIALDCHFFFCSDALCWRKPSNNNKALKNELQLIFLLNIAAFVMAQSGVSAQKFINKVQYSGSVSQTDANCIDVGHGPGAVAAENFVHS